MTPRDALATKGSSIEEWSDLHFFRPVGFRIARRAAGTSLTADHITIASLLVGLVAGHLFVYQSWTLNAAGLALFIISDILDSADGQLARLRGTSTRLGRILDGAADSLRFVNLYAHLAIRLALAGWTWGILLVVVALFSHSHQSMAVDFIKNAYRRFAANDHDALDHVRGERNLSTGGLTGRIARALYRDYLGRQAWMFPETVRLARRLAARDLAPSQRAAWESSQAPVVAACAWIAQNIRFAMLVAVVAGSPATFLWLTVVPLNVILVAIVRTHERRAARVNAPAARGATSRVYRGAFLGFGGIARHAHLPAFSQAPAAERFSIVAAVDAFPAVSGTMAPPVVRSMDQLLEFEPIDFVDICTPTASHVPLALEALEAGYHVLCEKPVAISRAEADRVVRAARRAGKVVFPCHQYRFNPVWKQIRHWLDEGAIGRWHLAELAVHRLEADRGASAAATPWRGQRDHARGGVLLDHGTHLIYSLIDLAGPPAAVDAWTGQLRHSAYDVEDSAHLLLEFPGRVATVFLTWAGNRRENHVRFVGERGEIHWHGDALVLQRGGVTESVDLSAQMDKKAYAGWFAEMFARFAEAMDHQDIEPGLADIIHVAAVLEDAYRTAAAKRSRIIPVP